MIDQFDRLACKTPLLRLDTARVQDVDEEGARMLTEALVKVRRSGHRVAMINATHLRDLLAPRVIPGTAALPEQWLLYLETLQQLGDEAAFEEFAIQYAVTFEQSPPSWDARWVSATLLPCAPEPAKPIGKQAVALQGEITGARQDAFAVLTAGDHPPGVVAQLREYRGYFWVIAAIVTALVTPPDAGSMIILLLVVGSLYEVGIVAAQMFAKHTKKPDTDSDAEAAKP